MIAGTDADIGGSTASHATINRSRTNPHRRMWTAKAVGRVGGRRREVSARPSRVLTLEQAAERVIRRSEPTRANRRRLDIGKGLCSSLERYIFSRIGRKQDMRDHDRRCARRDCADGTPRPRRHDE